MRASWVGQSWSTRFRVLVLHHSTNWRPRVMYTSRLIAGSSGTANRRPTKAILFGSGGLASPQWETEWDYVSDR